MAWDIVCEIAAPIAWLAVCIFFLAIAVLFLDELFGSGRLLLFIDWGRIARVRQFNLRHMLAGTTLICIALQTTLAMRKYTDWNHLNFLESLLACGMSISLGFGQLALVAMCVVSLSLVAIDLVDGFSAAARLHARRRGAVRMRPTRRTF
ncbi:MAG: hypothetical protein KDA41_20025 [Planctomycetales bacterium]|nr:hypothetical protein [Planctomycetales bacterium]